MNALQVIDGFNEGGIGGGGIALLDSGVTFTLGYFGGLPGAGVAVACNAAGGSRGLYNAGVMGGQLEMLNSLMMRCAMGM